jgi:hypothetical protein
MKDEEIGGFIRHPSAFILSHLLAFAKLAYTGVAISD